MKVARNFYLIFTLMAGMLAAQNPTFTGVVNAASGIPPGFPNSGLAQGSVFTAYGSNLGAAPAAPAVVNQAQLPLPTTAGLAGTTVTITVGGTTVTAPMLFTNQGQVAGIIPSNTPIGSGTLTLTYNGKSGSTPVTIVQSAFGISNIPLQFTDNGVGSGQAGIATFGSNQSQIVTNTDTAAPGDLLILWGTGLGAALNSGGDTAGATYGNIGTQPQVFVGGVQSPSVTYWGRSPGSVGLDQIVFTVPQNAPLGCNVGIVIQTTGGTTPVVSNGPTLSLAATDGATCSDPTQFFPTSIFSQTSSIVKGFLLGVMQRVSVNVNANGTTSTSTSTNAQASFGQFNQAQLTANAPIFLTANYQPSLGSCYSGFSNNPGANGPGPSDTPLNAGTTITLTPPSGQPLILTSQSTGSYSASGSTALPSGTWTFSNGAGGGSAGIGPLNFTFPVPQQVTWTNETATYSGQITRANPYTITWTGGDSNGYVDIQGYTDVGGYDVGFECTAPTSAQQFTIPSSFLLAMAPGAGANGSIQVSTIALPLTIGSVAGLNAALNVSQFSVGVPVIFK